MAAGNTQTEAYASGMDSDAHAAALVAAADLRVKLLSFQRRTEEITARNRLTPQRYLLLLLLLANAIRGDGTTVSSLADPLQMSQSSVTRLVQGAMREGLVDREADPSDQRRQYLRITDEGAARLEAAFRELGPERATLVRTLWEAPAVEGAALLTGVGPPSGTPPANV